MLLTHNVMSILLEALELTAERGRESFSKIFHFQFPWRGAPHYSTNGCGKTTLMRILAGLIRRGFKDELVKFSHIFMGHQFALRDI